MDSQGSYHLHLFYLEDAEHFFLCLKIICMCNLLTSFVSLLFLLKATDVHEGNRECVKEKIKSTFITHLEDKCWLFGASMKVFLLSRKNNTKKAIVWREKKKKKKTRVQENWQVGQCPSSRGRSAGMCGVRAGDSTLPPPSQRERMSSIHPFIHLFTHSPLCQTLGLVLETLGSGDR